MTRTMTLAGGIVPSSRPRRLAVENGHTYLLVDAACGLPVPQLVALLERGWRRDYRDRAVLGFDAAYVRWLLSGRRWFAVLVRDATGRLVGCEVAVERDVFWSGHELRGFYLTLLTVDPDHRGRGVAQRILKHVTRVALDERGADVLVSAFDARAAGRPTVERSMAGAGGRMHLCVSRPLRVWACSADLRLVDRYEPLQGAARTALLPGIHRALAFVADAGHVGPPLPSPGDVPDAARLQDVHTLELVPHSAARRGFGFRFRLADMYGPRDDQRAGARCFEFPPDERIAVAWHIATLVKPGLPDARLGTVQFVLPGRASARSQVRALRAVNSTLLRQGCLATTILNTGIVSRRVLWRAGFRPTNRTIHVAVRGPSAGWNRLPELSGPYVVDLL